MIVMKEPDAKEKATTLEDDAAIYQKREPKTERQKFGEMKNRHDKLKYLRTYYLKPALISIGIIAIAVYFIYTVFSPKDKCLMRVAFVDYPFSSALTDEMKADFIEAAGITLENHEVLEFDGSTYQISNSYDYSSSAVLATHIMAKELDIFIAPESIFRNYAFNGTIGSLTELLPSDLYSALSDYFFLSQVKQDDETIEEASGAEYVLGIYLDETPFWEEYGSYLNSLERPVIGIVTNSRNKEMAIDFIRYLFQ